MRLLHCISNNEGELVNVLLEAYPEAKAPPYAILSHRWGLDRDEVSFNEIDSDAAESKKKKGYAKILSCCRQALKDNISYIWIDTCCIDKSSSSELSEGINSMYSWYGRATVCYAYLEDVLSAEDPRAKGSSFRRSVWFTRGWTLQELIAPACVVFFAHDWVELGSKTSLADVIEDITKVEEKALIRTVGYKVSVAKRMSWAAKRQTARVEDRAYSLMGIFGVHLPAIYGEGSRAFTRLQTEILRVSNDHSIFAWQGNKTSYEMLAASPDQFTDASHFDPMNYNDFTTAFAMRDAKIDYAMTNAGLRIELPLLKIDSLKKVNKDDEESEEMYLAYLACRYGGSKGDYTWIYLKRSHKDHPSLYTRTSVGGHTTNHGKSIERSGVFIQQISVAEDDPSLFDTIEASLDKISSYKFIIDISGCNSYKTIDRTPANFWPDDLILKLKASGNYGTILFQNSVTGEAFAAVLGVHNWRVWSDIAVAKDSESAAMIHASYDFWKGEHGQFRWKGLDWVKKPRNKKQNSHIVMTVRKEQADVDHQATYVVKIVER